MFSFAGGHLGRLQPDGPARLSPGLWLELAKLDTAKETKIDSELILVGDPARLYNVEKNIYKCVSLIS